MRFKVFHYFLHLWKFREIPMMCRNIYRKKDLFQEYGAPQDESIYGFLDQ